MAVLTFNSKTLQLGILVGVLETYQPDEEIQQIYKDVEELRNKTNECIKSLTGDSDVATASKMLTEDAVKAEAWKKFLTEVYNVEIKKVIDNITRKNRQICPNYDAIMSSKTRKE